MGGASLSRKEAAIPVGLLRSGSQVGRKLFKPILNPTNFKKTNQLKRLFGRSLLAGGAAAGAYAGKGLYTNDKNRDLPTLMRGSLYDHLTRPKPIDYNVNPELNPELFPNVLKDYPQYYERSLSNAPYNVGIKPWGLR